MRTFLSIFIIFGLSYNCFGEPTVSDIPPPNPNRFIKSGSTVIDTRYNLQWQDNDDVQSKQLDWIEAINYCENLELDGFEDWRLPNLNELYYLADRSKASPSISDVFEYTKSSYYWTSTTVYSYKKSAWRIDFIIGYMVTCEKYYTNYVRCVRTIKDVEGMPGENEQINANNGEGTTTTPGTSESGTITTESESSGSETEF